MLSKNRRFHGLGSLKPVYKHGQTVRGDYLALRYYKNPRRKNYRVAVVVAKKVNKSAVKRNRIRRKLYEAIQANTKELNSTYDLVFSVYDEKLAETDQKQLEKQIAELLSQARVVS